MLQNCGGLSTKLCADKVHYKVETRERSSGGSPLQVDDYACASCVIMLSLGLGQTESNKE